MSVPNEVELPPLPDDLNTAEGQASAYARALQRYMDGFYSIAIDHGLSANDAVHYALHSQNAANGLYKMLRAQIAINREREGWLRFEWWMNHGAGLHMAYGDDGEMQCCSMDFKRMPIDSLRKWVLDRRLTSRILEAQ